MERVRAELHLQAAINEYKKIRARESAKRDELEGQMSIYDLMDKLQALPEECREQLELVAKGMLMAQQAQKGKAQQAESDGDKQSA